MSHHVTDLDIWRSASLVLKQHGDAAASVANVRTLQLLDVGDDMGAVTWARIRDAVEVLRKVPDAADIRN